MSKQTERLAWSKYWITSLAIFASFVLFYCIWVYVHEGRNALLSFLNPAFWAGMVPLTVFGVVFKRELMKRKLVALPYLCAYGVASMFYSVFISFVMLEPEIRSRTSHLFWYLVFTTSVLVLGLILHWRVARRRPN